jgi:DNA-binding HxlR family transcriptional regulator
VWTPDEVREVVVLLGRRWVLETLDALRAGAIRRHVLRERVGGVSDKVLTSVVRNLEDAGLVHRTIHHGSRPTSTFELTDRARSLDVPLSELARRWRGR